MCLSGSVEIILSVVKNGQNVEGARFESGGGYNILFLRTDKLSLTSTVKCKAGDKIQIRLEARRQTKIGAYRILIYNDPDNSFVSFTPELTTNTGDIWKVSRNLPDMTVKAIMVGIAYELCGTWLVDPVRHQVHFAYFDEVPNRIDEAVDWSNRIDTGKNIKWIPRLEPYGQINLLTWKEIEETKKAARMVGAKLLNYGEGVITINAPVLEAEVTLFEMPFAASTDSEQALPGYGKPVLVKIRTVSGRGESLSINTQSTEPRLLLASLGEGFPVKSNRFKADGVTLEPVTLNLQPCWFGKRPDVINSLDTLYTLSFGPIGLSRGEKTAVERYYNGLGRVLRRMRGVEVTMRLKPSDVAKLDFRLPIRLKRVQVGPLTISDGFYYINKVSDYQADSLCVVSLIAF